MKSSHIRRLEVCSKLVKCFSEPGKFNEEKTQNWSLKNEQTKEFANENVKTKVSRNLNWNFWRFIEPFSSKQCLKLTHTTYCHEFLCTMQEKAIEFEEKCLVLIKCDCDWLVNLFALVLLLFNCIYLPCLNIARISSNVLFFVSGTFL